jgi:4-nitrophenyl phosphatase
MTSGEATARYLSEHGFAGKRVYVIGRDGLVRTLERHGFDVDGADEGEPCDFVVVGWDRGITFDKIARAQHEIIVNKAKLIATNRDAMFPADEGRVLPGAGAMVAAVEVASNTKALLIGKPEIHSLSYLIGDIVEGREIRHDSVWVVGDRLDTDIACGNAYGAKTVCVTTGITSREEAENAKGEFRPDYVIDSLTGLSDLILKT